MKSDSQGFFCVVYFTDTKKTAYYHKVWNPSKLAGTLQNWKWVKVFVDKQIYFSNTKTYDYYRIFDDKNPVTDFTYKPFSKKL